MAGIYIHVPFCKTRCTYCDFYSIPRSELKDRYVDALCKELAYRQSYFLPYTNIETLYFGGGTPSLLSEQDFEKIFRTIRNHYLLDPKAEITLEANPDDLDDSYAEMLSNFPFNRISIGIQTFDNEILQRIKRRHNSIQALESVLKCRKYGFKNINIDLIYGLPGGTVGGWINDLHRATALRVEHISAYHLTYEKGTPLYRQLQRKRVKTMAEDDSVISFNILMREMLIACYEHYEISNFCRPGFHSRHNSAYWEGVPYLGCGPSAHSFNGTEREWNVSSVHTYVKGIKKNARVFEKETLSLTMRYNERIITALRTKKGLSLPALKEDFGTELYDYFLRISTPYCQKGLLEIANERLKLTRIGIFTSDSIMSDLLWVE